MKIGSPVSKEKTERTSQILFIDMSSFQIEIGVRNKVNICKIRNGEACSYLEKQYNIPHSFIQYQL